MSEMLIDMTPRERERWKARDRALDRVCAGDTVVARVESGNGGCRTEVGIAELARDSKKIIRLIPHVLGAETVVLRTSGGTVPSVVTILYPPLPFSVSEPMHRGALIYDPVDDHIWVRRFEGDHEVAWMRVDEESRVMDWDDLPGRDSVKVLRPAALDDREPEKAGATWTASDGTVLVRLFDKGTHGANPAWAGLERGGRVHWEDIP